MDDKGYLYDLLVHDLRSPLSVVSATTAGLLDKMDRYGSLTEQQKNCLYRIQRNTKRAQLILNEILDIGRSEERIFKAETFLLDGVLKDSFLNVLESLDEVLTEKLQRAGNGEDFIALLAGFGISVAITGRYEKSPFFHDRRKIQLIIENLVSNALKYRRKTLSVSISGEDDITITVSDDGAGIPKKEQETVYGRFMQCSNAELSGIQGLGLGLFCVKSLVETMDGAIALTSVEGSGTSFVVKIPPLDRRKEVRP
jgi:signal transduction histidine kinase